MSNYLKQNNKQTNEEYLENLFDKNTEQIMASYHDFYILTPVSVRSAFQNFVELTLEVPNHLLYMSEFIPFYILEEISVNQSDYSFQYFEQLKNKNIDSVKYQNFYLPKDTFEYSYIKDTYIPKSNHGLLQ